MQMSSKIVPACCPCEAKDGVRPLLPWRLVCHLLSLLAFLTSWVSSLDHQETEQESGFDEGLCWANASV